MTDNFYYCKTKVENSDHFKNGATPKSHTSKKQNLILKKMKSIKFFTLGLLIVGSTFLTSCKKEGCTDPDSKNYNADAKKEDGTCQYEGRALFWYNQAASTGLQNDGAITLIYYVQGKVVGSSATAVYWTASPECGQNGSITVTKDLGGVKNKSYTYSVKDHTGFEYWTGILNFTANSCEAVQLTW